MGSPLHLFLHALHFFYRVFTLVASWKSQPRPHKLSDPRKQIPRHLALLLVSDGSQSTSEDADLEDAVLECYLESAQQAVGWCRTVGIRELTVYDRDGTAINIPSRFARVTNINPQVFCPRMSSECPNVFPFPFSITQRKEARKSSIL